MYARKPNFSGGKERERRTLVVNENNKFFLILFLPAYQSFPIHLVDLLKHGLKIWITGYCSGNSKMFAK